jgi:hypothetical protein
MPSGNGDDRFHFAANACVVYEKKTGRSSEMKEAIIVWKDNLAVKQDARKMQNKHSQQQEKRGPVGHEWRVARDFLRKSSPGSGEFFTR